MNERSLPSNVHPLRPRTKSLSDRLDEFLEKHALAPTETPFRCDPTRPKSSGINAILCASCGRAEYLTRDYCRCGHYIRGQLEDEFLSWMDGLEVGHNNLVEVAMRKAERVRLLFPLSLPFIVWPLLSMAYGGSAPNFFQFFSFTIGFSLIAIAAIIEAIILRPVHESMRAASQATFQTFMEERVISGWESTMSGLATRRKKDELNE